VSANFSKLSPPQPDRRAVIDLRQPPRPRRADPPISSAMHINWNMLLGFATLAATLGFL